MCVPHEGKKKKKKLSLGQSSKPNVSVSIKHTPPPASRNPCLLCCLHLHLCPQTTRRQKFSHTHTHVKHISIVSKAVTTNCHSCPPHSPICPTPSLYSLNHLEGTFSPSFLHRFPTTSKRNFLRKIFWTAFFLPLYVLKVTVAER